MYDFHDDARNHHGSQCKHWTAYKRQSPSLAWALLGTLGHSWTLLETLWALLESFTFRHILEIGKLCSFGLWAKITKSKK